MFVSKTPWILLLLLWMAGSTWWHVCHVKQLCADLPLPFLTDSTGTQSADIAPPPISDGDRFRLELPGNFSFAQSGDMANMDAMGSSLTELVNYLKNNPDRRLTIIGYYTADEDKPVAFDNLGLARAETVRRYLVQQGAPNVSLTTQGQLITLPDVRMAPTPTGDSLRGGLAFAFAGMDVAQPGATSSASSADNAPLTDLTTPTAPDTAQKKLLVATLNTEAELAAAEKFTSVFKPIDLYFKLNGSNYIQTPDTRKFFDEATQYLKTHKTKQLRLTGHTDNSGNDATNLRLSRNRANDVKARLRSSGISASQIVVDARGETAPKADNSTIAGRRANRRVTVVVQ